MLRNNRVLPLQRGVYVPEEWFPVDTTFNYDPSQDRDNTGKWTSGGGGSSGPSAPPAARSRAAAILEGAASVVGTGARLAAGTVKVAAKVLVKGLQVAYERYGDKGSICTYIVAHTVFSGASVATGGGAALAGAALFGLASVEVRNAVAGFLGLVSPDDRQHATDMAKRGLVKNAGWASVDNSDCGTGAGGFKPGNTCASGDVDKKAKELVRLARPGKSETTQKRAKSGGEIGPNDEWYPGGAFIATTDLPKKVKQKIEKSAGKGREQIDYGSANDWAEVPPGQMPILQLLGPGYDPRKKEFIEQYLDYSRTSSAERTRLQELLSLFKSGERFVSMADYPDRARIKDVARAVVAGVAVPGESLAKMPEDLRSAFVRYKPKPTDNAVANGKDEGLAQYILGFLGDFAASANLPKPKVTLEEVEELIAEALGSRKRRGAPTGNEEWMPVDNVFCATGEGGGVDPTCSPRESSSTDDGREFKTIGHITVSHGKAKILYDPEVVSEESANRAKKWLEQIPQPQLSKSVVRRIEIFENPEDMYVRMGEVGIDPEIEESGQVRGAFDFETKTLYASTWAGDGHSARTLYHELGHSILGTSEEAAENWAQSHLSYAEGIRHTTENKAWVPVDNVFCPTGEGGGVDPTCSPGESPPSAKAARAKASAKRIDRDVQRYAEEGNEARFATLVEGKPGTDSQPADVITKDGDGVELKTMVDNSNSKITMDTYAQVRKLNWESEQGKTFHTVIADDTKVMNALGEGQHDDSKRVYYYRRGVAGSARLSSLLKVESDEELKRVMALPEEELPKAAQRTDAKLRVGKWEPTMDEGRKAFRNSETGEVVRAKK